jgi:release factor glutamine methyltransferase
MTHLKHLKEAFIEELSSVYDRDEASTLFSWLAEDLLHLKTHDLLLNTQVELENNLLLKFEEAKARLKRQEPIQYILGYTEFFGLTLKVNPHVLIPRPETEELVQWILDDHQSSGLQLSIIDLGTGSGCIPIALAKHMPQAKIKALDISAEALELARSNQLACLKQTSEENRTYVEFVRENVLKLDALPVVDIVVSNPPYVTYNEKLKMKDNVLKNEPHLALFVEDDDPLLFYRKIADLALKAKNRPLVYVEISQYLAKETRALFKEFGFQHVEIKKDFRGNDRMLKAY